MKTLVFLILLVPAIACEPEKGKEYRSTEFVSSNTEQVKLYSLLKNIVADSLANSGNDTFSFLILPVQASCPSCRKKTIDSIMSYIQDIPLNHYIIIASNGGRKSTNSYFREQAYELPPLSKYFILDSTNLTYKMELYKDRPTIYYATNQRVYKKVSSRPSTVREDLKEFFSGHRER